MRGQHSGKVISLNSRRHLARTPVHGEKVITGQLVPFPAHLLKQARPVFRWDTSAFAPFLNRSPLLAKIRGHRGKRVPLAKNVLKGSHNMEFASDGLSGQDPPMIPMTVHAPERTISPMGRAVTPVRFRAEMAKRLSSARVVAGFATKKMAADALGVGLDRYEKWENGRTPVPAQYVGTVCEVFGIDANYLFGIAQAAHHRKVAGS